MQDANPTDATILKSLQKDGMYLMQSALREEEVGRLLTMVDDMYLRFISGSISNYSLDTDTARTMPDLWKTYQQLPRAHQSFRRWNIVADDPEFVGLVDHDRIFGAVIEIMGEDIQLFKSQMIVVPAGIREAAYLHTDAGSMAKMCVVPGSEQPMISVQIFLTDLPDENMGNFTYVPGSHRNVFPADPHNAAGTQTSGYVQGTKIEGRRQVTAMAGDAVFFPHSLWHGISENTSAAPRKSLIYSYSKIYLRPYDYEKQPPELLNRCTPRQRRLLGDWGDWYWRPGCTYHPAPDQSEVVRLSRHE